MADERAKRIADFIGPLRVKPGSKVDLAKDFDPGYKAGFLKKKDGKELLRTGIALLADYQARLAAQDTYGVLVCLQALDAGGKDGTIRHVMSGVNPQGVHVSGFKVPSAEELDHDFLWRYARRLPARGDIGIFNRSHYEEVLVVRVHPEILDRQKLPKEAKGKGVWDRRYREINDWERYLSDNGFKVVKLFLNLSKEEQRTRFLRRIDLAEKNWKFSAADVRERQRWDDYQKAFSEMLSATSTRWAPWYVIPADRKWFARICAGAVLAHTLIEIDPHYPVVGADRRQELLTIKAELEAEAPKGAPADPFAAKEKAKKKAKARASEEAKTADSQVGGDADQPHQAQGRTASEDQPARSAPRTSRARTTASQEQPARSAPRTSRARTTPAQEQPARSAPRTSRARTTPAQEQPARSAPRTSRARTTPAQEQPARSAPRTSRARTTPAQEQPPRSAPRTSRARTKGQSG